MVTWTSRVYYISQGLLWNYLPVYSLTTNKSVPQNVTTTDKVIDELHVILWGLCLLIKDPTIHHLIIPLFVFYNHLFYHHNPFTIYKVILKITLLITAIKDAQTAILLNKQVTKTIYFITWSIIFLQLFHKLLSNREETSCNKDIIKVCQPLLLSWCWCDEGWLVCVVVVE